MPPKTGTAATAPAGSSKAVPARKAAPRRSAPAAGASAAPASVGPASPLELLRSLSIRSVEPRSEADNQRLTRSFHLTVGAVERAKATADGIQHRAYGTDFEDEVPKSLSAFVTWCLELGCTFWEDAVNEGQEFRRIRNLSPGPSPEGARQGAAKRAAARNSRTAGG